MKKISKKIIPLNYINKLNKELDIYVYKKGLYRYLLPGKFNLPIKNYFKSHTYIDFVLNKELISSLIVNKNVILFNYKTYVFMNNPNILRFVHKNVMFESLFNISLFKRFFLLTLFHVSE